MEHATVVDSSFRRTAGLKGLSPQTEMTEMCCSGRGRSFAVRADDSVGKTLETSSQQGTHIYD